MIRVADEWKIEEKGKDNGIIILIARDEKKIHIEVGRGLEEALTDLLSGRIIEEMEPLFSSGNYYDGLNLCVKNVIKTIKDEYKAEGKRGWKSYWPYIFSAHCF